jgi:hypothetical protein
MGMRDKPIAPASRWRNAFAERLVDSIRRERVDHLIVLGRARPRRIPRSYARYYDEISAHRSLNKDAPLSRAVQNRNRCQSSGTRTKWESRAKARRGIVELA